jgi:hypothetical protein
MQQKEYGPVRAAWFEMRRFAAILTHEDHAGAPPVAPAPRLDYDLVQTGAPRSVMTLFLLGRNTTWLHP